MTLERDPFATTESIGLMRAQESYSRALRILYPDGIKRRDLPTVTEPISGLAFHVTPSTEVINEGYAYSFASPAAGKRDEERSVYLVRGDLASGGIKVGYFKVENGMLGYFADLNDGVKLGDPEQLQFMDELLDALEKIERPDLKIAAEKRMETRNKLRKVCKRSGQLILAVSVLITSGLKIKETGIPQRLMDRIENPLTHNDRFDDEGYSLEGLSLPMGDRIHLSELGDKGDGADIKEYSPEIKEFGTENEDGSVDSFDVISPESVRSGTIRKISIPNSFDNGKSSGNVYVFFARPLSDADPDYISSLKLAAVGPSKISAELGVATIYRYRNNVRHGDIFYTYYPEDDERNKEGEPIDNIVTLRIEVEANPTNENRYVFVQF